MSPENPSGIGKPREPSFAKAAPPVSPKRFIYLQAGIASIGGGWGSIPVPVKRHEVVLRLTACGRPFHFEAGALSGSASALAVPPSQTHLANCPDANFITYAVNPIHPQFRAACAVLSGQTQVLEHSQFSHLSARMEAACTGTLSVEGCSDLMDGLLQVLLAASRPAPPLDPRVPWVMRKLDVDINHPFEQLAADLHLSPSRLSHLFSKELGLSFRSYQSWARVRQAWEMLLLKRDMSIAEVAHDLGFADPAHLARSFQLTFGFSPSELRDPRVFEPLGGGMPPGHHIPRDLDPSAG